MKKLLLFFAVLSLGLTSCDSAKFLETVDDILGGNTGGVSNTEIGQGLRQALEIGIGKGSTAASKTDGYFKNPIIKILWPDKAKKVANTLNTIGLGSMVNKVEMSLNRAAEKAAKESKPIFVNAIRQLTFQDVMSILKGEKNAATNFLRRTTTNQLRTKFNPIIGNALNSVNATKYWDEAINKYNAIPLTNKIDLDLQEYVTDRALDGLFKLVEKEEAKIRQDPLARTTDLLKRVFKLQDA